jgi:uncharacterized protein
MDRRGEDVEGTTTRISYLYFMSDAHERIRAVAPDHAEYWRSRRLGGYLGGPFADRSGGLITFDAVTDEEVERLIDDDPFVRNGLIRASWTKRWIVEPGDRRT